MRYHVKKYSMVWEVPHQLWQDHEAISTWLMVAEVISDWSHGRLKESAAVVGPRTWELTGGLPG